ncbi:hypothetical protein QL285_022436 [Trifolium repens]|nr:hypothetical protein QL285_022436 [Trifolium repens]
MTYGKKRKLNLSTDKHVVLYGDFVFSAAIFLLLLSTPCSSYSVQIKPKTKSAVFLSPKFELGHGSVINRFYHDIDFPRGHVALKSFNGEVVDEDGNPIPLHETYLHHWAILRYYQSKNATQENIDVPNSGTCQENILRHYFSLGSETQGTTTYIPDPFGIEIGNPAEIPEGFEEKWLINIHAIDTRGAEDKVGCTECKCDLYNVTVDEYGKAIKPDYKGVPVKIYIIDVTDSLKISDDSKGMDFDHSCEVEYTVEACSTDHKEGNGCVHVKRTSLPLQTGGYVIYGAAHQHLGAIGSTLFGQDGRVICSSIPSYGNGNEAGNEDGYLVSMSTCYPKSGSVKIIN